MYDVLKKSRASASISCLHLVWRGCCQVYASLLLIRDGNATAVSAALLAVSMFCPLASNAAGAKGLSAPAHRHRLEGAGQAPLLAGGVVRPGGVHGAGGSAVLCGVPVPAGPLRQLAGDGLRRRDGRRRPCAASWACPALSYILETGLVAITLAPAINMFFALGEEAGWRGYMMPRLKERFGLLNGRMLGGVIWGVWHWPHHAAHRLRVRHALSGRAGAGPCGVVRGLLCPQHPAGLALREDRLHLGARCCAWCLQCHCSAVRRC